MVRLNGRRWKKLSVIPISIEPQRLCSLPARFLPGDPRIDTVHDMAPQDAVYNHPAPPFRERIRVSVTLEELYILLVGLSAFGFIALTIFVDNLCFCGHLWGDLCSENSTVRLVFRDSVVGYL